MPEYNLVKQEVARPTYWGWAANVTNPHQSLLLEVISFDEEGGSDAKGNVCPRLVGTVLKDTVSYRDKGTTEVKVAEGTRLTVECGIWSLKDGLPQVDPRKGDIVFLEYVGTIEVGNGTVKEIDISLDRRSDKVSAASGPADEDV